AAPRPAAPPGRNPVKAAGCQRLLAPAEDLPLSSGKPAPREIPVVPGALAFAPPLPSLSAGAPCQITRPFHLLSPPIDLAVRLQRLLILACSAPGWFRKGNLRPAC